MAATVGLCGGGMRHPPVGVGWQSVTAAAASTVTVSGVVFRDLNNNGVRDAGEPGVPGIRVHRNSGAGTPTVTGSGGHVRP